MCICIYHFTFSVPPFSSLLLLEFLNFYEGRSVMNVLVWWGNRYIVYISCGVLNTCTSSADRWSSSYCDLWQSSWVLFERLSRRTSESRQFKLTESTMNLNWVWYFEIFPCLSPTVKYTDFREDLNYYLINNEYVLYLV